MVVAKVSLCRDPQPIFPASRNRLPQLFCSVGNNNFCLLLCCTCLRADLQARFVHGFNFFSSIFFLRFRAIVLCTTAVQAISTLLKWWFAIILDERVDEITFCFFFCVCGSHRASSKAKVCSPFKTAAKILLLSPVIFLCAAQRAFIQ